MSEPSSERIAVVTGGAGGIGRATVLRLAADGFAVAVWDVDRSQAADVARAVVSRGGRSTAVGCDVTDRESVAEAARATIDTLGAPWALVNNAGIDRMSLFKDSDPSDWADIVGVNLLGTMNVTHAFVGGLVEQGSGRVVCISSDAARVGATGESVYSASKAGVLGFVKALAREVARHGVCVNAVCPGPTDTALLDVVRSGPNGDRIVDAMVRAVPMGRIARPEEIAGVIAFFLSDDAGYVTGQTLSVSGGLTMV